MCPDTGSEPKKSMVKKKIRSLEQIHAYWLRPDEANETKTYTKGSIGRSMFLMNCLRRHAKRRSRILELGCNAGRNLAFLHHAGFKSLAGIEINSDAVTNLRETFPELKRAEITIAPIEDVIREIPDDSYDIIFTMAVLEHIHWDSEWIFREMSRIAPKIMTIEDEVTESPRHFRRSYNEVFAGLGLNEVEAKEDVPGLPQTFRYRLFERPTEVSQCNG